MGISELDYNFLNVQYLQAFPLLCYLTRRSSLNSKQTMYTIMNYLFDKANNLTSSMVYLQFNLFWIILKRFVTNPIETVADVSARQMSSFLATANKKLMFEPLSEIAENGYLSRERERFHIIRTILQEYGDIIFGAQSWLNEKTLGTTFFNHLVNPKKFKRGVNRQRRFKQYTVSLSK